MSYVTIPNRWPGTPHSPPIPGRSATCPTHGARAHVDEALSIKVIIGRFMARGVFCVAAKDGVFLPFYPDHLRRCHIFRAPV